MLGKIRITRSRRRISSFKPSCMFQVRSHRRYLSGSLGEPPRAHDVLETLLETEGGLGSDRLKARDEGRQRPAGLPEIGGLEDPLGVGGRLRPVTARGTPEEVTQEMDLAALPGDPLKRLAGLLDRTRVAVRDDP